MTFVDAMVAIIFTITGPCLGIIASYLDGIYSELRLLRKELNDLKNK